jgi:polysaccharide biosynthesis/export protein
MNKTINFKFLSAFLILGLMSPSLSFPAEVQDRFVQLREEEIQAKQKRAQEIANKIEMLNKQIEEQRKEANRTQEGIWKEFSQSLEMERKTLKEQMQSIDDRQRLFEKELEKKREQDEIQARERDNEIKNLMMEMQGLHTEVEQDRKVLEQEKQNLNTRSLGAAAERLNYSQPMHDERDDHDSRPSETLTHEAIKITRASGDELMGKSQMQAKQFRSEYYLEVGDQVEIDVWRVPDLTRVTTVRPDGRISLPLVGDLDVTGISLVELRQILTKKFSEYVRNPQVSLSIRQFGGRKFVILGEVTSPGVYRFQQEITLIEGIALAGGFKLNARRGKVMIIRGDIHKDPQVKIISANMENVFKKGMISENLFILPNDILYVGKDFIGDYREILDNFIEPTMNGFIDFFVLRSAIRTAQEKTS